jgi:hypothetical protein
MARLNARTSLRALSALLLGFSLIAAGGCGDTEGLEQFEQDEATELGRIGEAITGGWTTLTLTNGWQNYWGTSTPPAIGVVNGVVTFRGALKATSPTSNSPFTVPTAFRPNPNSVRNMRVVLSGGAGGTLFIELDGKARVIQDGVAPIGSAAKTLTSLDGVAYDLSEGTGLAEAGDWEFLYGFRQPPGAHVKMVDGFVRFQGLLAKPDCGSADYDGFLFTLPTTYRPSNSVWVATQLGAGSGSGQSWGRLTISPNGNVFVDGNPPAANCGTSFEGVSYSKTLSGNIPLSLINGWSAYSARSVKVGKYGGVVRFQGAVSGGTSTTLATLPTDMRPPRTVYLVAGAYGPVPARIVISTSGNVSVDSPSLSVASLFLSLDGVSFGL